MEVVNMKCCSCKSEENVKEVDLFGNKQFLCPLCFEHLQKVVDEADGLSRPLILSRIVIEKKGLEKLVAHYKGISTKTLEFIDANILSWNRAGVRNDVTPQRAWNNE